MQLCETKGLASGSCSAICRVFRVLRSAVRERQGVPGGVVDADRALPEDLGPPGHAGPEGPDRGTRAATAHVPLGNDLVGEDSDGDDDFLQVVKHYAENQHLRLEVSAATDIGRGTKKAIKAKVEAYVKTVRHCPAPERCWLSSWLLTIVLAVIAAGQDS